MRRSGELALGIGALAMAGGAFVGHALVPDRVADHYGWVRERWYQREIGAFNAGLGYGIVAYARGRRVERCHRCRGRRPGRGRSDAATARA